MPRPDLRAIASRRLAEERELSPAIISLLAPVSGRAKGVRQIAVDRIEANPEQPRLTMDDDGLKDLAASIREHGVLQPILVRPLPDGRYQLIAGERRWRASRMAGVADVPAMIEEIDDDTALEIAIIENLQREDLSPLDEAIMYDRMTRRHGYSLRRLAQKIGKDKGYVENRLRLADAPPEIKQLVSVRKDTLSHAYELLKVQDPKKRARLAEQVASGELSLVKLRDRIEGRRTTRPRASAPDTSSTRSGGAARSAVGAEPESTRSRRGAPEIEMTLDRRVETPRGPLADDALVDAKSRFADALDELLAVLRSESISDVGEVDRSNLAKYLTIAKLKLENAIAMVRPPDLPRRR